MPGLRSLVALSRFAMAALLVGTLLLGAGTATAAAPGEVMDVKLPGCYASAIAPALGGGVWVRQCGGREHWHGNFVVKVAPDGTATPSEIPHAMEGPLATGSGGEVWIAARPPESREDAGLERLDPDGSLHAFSFPRVKLPLQIDGLAVGAEGALWATAGEPLFVGPGYASEAGRLVRVAADGSQAEFPLPDEIEPRGIALGGDGNLWFTAVHGSYDGEHSSSEGVGYIGRMTPAGALTLFPTPIEGAGPGPIVDGPDGRLWFGMNDPEAIGTIATDGTFGGEFKLRHRPSLGGLTFGPEGDLWIAGGEAGLLRMTPGGQLTQFGNLGRRTEGVTTGAEGDIWSQSTAGVRRTVPGAPGLQAWGLVTDRATGKASVHLACGGSSSGCAGTLELRLRYRLPPHRHKLREFRLARFSYAVGAEAEKTVATKIPAKAFALAARARSEAPYEVRTIVSVKASVVGGPALDAALRVPSLEAGEG